MNTNIMSSTHTRMVIQLTNITFSFDVKSESIYYGKTRIKCDLEQGYCPPNHAIKATIFWEPNNHCRISDVGRSYARMIKFQKRYFIETLENNEPNWGHKQYAQMYSSRFQKDLYEHLFMINPHFLVSRSSQNLYINVTKISHIMLHNIKIFLLNTKKGLILLQAKHQQNLKTYTQLFLLKHPLSHHILKEISAMDMLSYKNHLFNVNLKCTNFLENKFGLVLSTQMYRLMQNSTLWLSASYQKRTTQVYLFTKNFAI